MRWAIVFSALVMACGGGGGDGDDDGDDGTSPPPPPTPVSTVTIAPGPALTLSVGATSQLTATARDQQGNVLTGREIAWTTTAQSVATVSNSGLVTAAAVGSAQIRATSEGKIGEITITVEALPWTLTGSLTTGRTLHSATLLADGRVLVTGGQAVGTTQSLRSAEVYNPATGTWTSTGDMITGRTNHVAVRLQNGRVMVAGGVSVEQQTRLASVEIYDPSTGTWSATGNLVTARQLAGAVVLNDGRVLLFGGSGPNGTFDPLATSELYNPATGQWATAGSMTVPRVGHAAVLLSNGRVLASGGATNSISGVVLHASSEVFNPSTGQWTGSGNVLTARSVHTALLLANGQPLIVGGSNYASTAYGATDVYDPVSGGWTAAGSMLTARVSHTATRLPNGKVLAAGGTGTTGTIGSAELYDPATGSWSAAASLRVARLNHAAVLLNTGKVLVMGGQGAGASTSAELFDPAVGASISGRVR